MKGEEGCPRVEALLVGTGTAWSLGPEVPGVGVGGLHQGGGTAGRRGRGEGRDLGRGRPVFGIPSGAPAPAPLLPVHCQSRSWVLQQVELVVASTRQEVPATRWLRVHGTLARGAGVKVLAASW